MDLLLQHSSGAHSAVNEGGWGPKSNGKGWKGGVGFTLQHGESKTWGFVS